MVMNIDKLVFVSKCILLNEKNEFLILKRTNYKNDGTEGLWDIPGGSVDLDEDVNEAVKREVSEELQIDLINPKVFSVDSGKGNPSGQYMFVIFYCRDYDLKEGIKLSQEHSELKWISVNEMDNYKYYLKDNRIQYIKDFLNSLK